jgi:osmoprotectant transport system ATP-binding protein
VENFLGFDRGIRRLSFLAASGLSLDDRAVVGEETAASMAADAARQAGEDWVLVTDSGHRPRGWAAADDLEGLPAGSQAGQARLEPYGHTFDVRTDSLRAALDATVLSPTGQAAGVDDDGQVVGVTTYERLRAAIQAADQAAPAAGRDSAPKSGARDGVAASGQSSAPAGTEPQSPAPEKAS